MIGPGRSETVPPNHGGSGPSVSDQDRRICASTVAKGSDRIRTSPRKGWLRATIISRISTPESDSSEASVRWRGRRQAPSSAAKTSEMAPPTITTNQTMTGITVSDAAIRASRASRSRVRPAIAAAWMFPCPITADARRCAEIWQLALV